MRRLRAICLAGVLTGALWMAPPAWTPSVSALSCVEIERQLPQLETVVQGRITEIAQGRVQLAVERYFKGSGPAELAGDVVSLGQGHRMDWIREPQQGDQVVIGFKQGAHGLVNDLCTPLINLSAGERIDMGLLGSGRPPTGAEAGAGTPANPGAPNDAEATDNPDQPGGPGAAPPANPQAPGGGMSGSTGSSGSGDIGASDGPGSGDATVDGTHGSSGRPGEATGESGAPTDARPLSVRLWPWATGALVCAGAFLWLRRR